MPNSNDNLVNIQAAAQAAQVANLAAQLEFSKERFRLLELPEFQFQSQQAIDAAAWNKAKDQYQIAFQEASLTGTYQGQPTTEWLTQMAQMTGVLPNGTKTIQGALSDAQIAQINATIMNTNRGMDLQYAQYNTQREQWDAQHQMDLKNQQAQLTGYIDGLPTFEREQWQANQGQAYLNLLGSLRGPENAFAQLKVLRNSPDALKQMAQSWAGQFSAPTTTGSAGAPTAITPQNMLTPGINQNGVAGATTPALPGPTPTAPPGLPNVPTYVPAPIQSTSPVVMPPAGAIADPANAGGAMLNPATGQPLNAVPPYTISPPGSSAPVHAYNYQADVTGGTQVYPPGIQAPVEASQVSTTQPLAANTQTALAQHAAGVPTQASTPVTGGGVTTPATLVNPGQINAREYNKATDYEKTLGWASYEDAGWDKTAAQQVFQKSLPKYGVSSGAQGAVKL